MSSSCSTVNSNNIKSYEEAEEIFNASYEEVWRAAQTLLGNRFRLVTFSQDEGLFVTVKIAPQDNSWTHPVENRQLATETWSQITVKIIRGYFKDGQNVIKVVIRKNLFLNRDFFSQPEQLKSDGLEEKILLYRIQREIEIERAILKMQQYNQKKANK